MFRRMGSPVAAPAHLVARTVARAAAGEDASDVEADFVYDSLNTCAGCGLCSTACPVDINTGDLTRLLRGRKLGAASLRIGEWTVGNFGKVATAARAASPRPRRLCRRW